MAQDDNPRLADNTKLIEWVSSIYAVFWAVWFGFLISHIVRGFSAPGFLSKGMQDTLQTYGPIVFPVILTVLMSGYTYFLVKWLWGMRPIQYGTSYVKVFGMFSKGLKIWAILIAVVAALAVLCSIPWAWFWLGTWSTLAWLALVAAVVLVDREGWDG